ncbi:hypothetical protein C6P45_003341 [Maudiozyma exigua]|uniref:Uncharacterized protein n=1 Tax=Maudiozyma exigua TaxID=34358 RepID=A0A9P7B2B2_MAUEX|nr:hypothetical protein C6P45_003341 [Kazachstania exigua]
MKDSTGSNSNSDKNSNSIYSKNSITTSMDVIDKLDQSGFPGSSFHHDGPFDVISPKRNSKDNKNAPILAFPNDKDEPIKSIPKSRYSKREEKFDIDILDDIFGTNDVDDDDSFMTESDINPDNSDGDILDTRAIHGRYTDGLGTSTFLDGAGASKRRLQTQRTNPSSELLIDFSNDNDDFNDTDGNDIADEDIGLISASSTNYQRFNKSGDLIDLENTIKERPRQSKQLADS